VVLKLILLLFLLAFGRETYYCIQALSTNSEKEALRAYEKLSDLPNARVEKIGNLYTLRVGLWERKEEALSLLSSVRSEFPDAFVRRCYYIPERVIAESKGRKPRVKVSGNELRVFGKDEEEIVCGAVLKVFEQLPKKEPEEKRVVEFKSAYPYSVADAINYVLILHKKEGFVPVRCKLTKKGNTYKLVLEGYRSNQRVPYGAADYASVRRLRGGVALRLLEED